MRRKSERKGKTLFSEAGTNVVRVRGELVARVDAAAAVLASPDLREARKREEKKSKSGGEKSVS
jgi:hypothetical protein